MRNHSPLIAAFILHLTLVWVGSRGDDPLTTDSFQYINVARNIAQGRGVVSNIVPLDREQSGLFPYARQPPGFPALLALLSRAGIPLRVSVIVLPVLGSFAALLMLYVVARRISPQGAGLVLLLFGLGYPFAETANRALTEPLFLAFLLAALLVGERAMGRPRVGGLRLAYIAGILAVFPLVLRYSGAAPLALLAGVILIRTTSSPPEFRSEARRRLVAWTAGASTAGSLLLVVLARAGSPTDLPPPFFSFQFSLFQYARFTGRDLLLPYPHVPAGTALGILGAVLLLAGPLLAFIGSRTRSHRDPATDEAASDGGLLPSFAAFYPLCNVLLLAWAATVAYLNGWPTRHLAPAYPFLFLTLAGCLPRGRRARACVSAAILLAYGTGNILLVAADRSDPAPQMDLGSIPLWIEAHTKPGDTLVATEAELLEHAVPDRRYIALVRFPYSRRPLGPEDLRRLPRQQGARYVILLEGRTEELGAGLYGPLLKAVARGEEAPGLRVVARLPGGLVLEIAEPKDLESPIGSKLNSPRDGS